MRKFSHWGLIAILATFCLLGVVYTTTIPLFEAPDEIWHFAFIQKLADERAIPVRPLEKPDVWLRESGQPPLYHFLASLTITPMDTSDFPGFVRFNPDHPFVTEHSDSTAPNLFIHTSHEAMPYQGTVQAVHALRLMTLLLGAATLVAIYLVAAELMPAQPILILAAVALAAFNPGFIFISSVINNDAASALLATLTLWLAIRLAKGRTTPTWEIILGIILGLALLTKVSALALPALVLLALFLRWRGDHDLKQAAFSGAIIFGLALLISGWWYGRNWLLYGDPLAWEVWLADIGRHQITALELLRQFDDVALSFWQPYEGLLAELVLVILGLLLVVAIGGWLMIAWQSIRGKREKGQAKALLIAAVWLAIVFASLVRYMATTPAAQGRLLFPALASISALLVLGIDAILPGRLSRFILAAVIAGLLLLSLLTPFLAIAPLFPKPVLASTAELPELTPFAGEADLQTITESTGIRPIGVEVKPATAGTGDNILVNLYWQVQRPPGDLSAVLQLWSMGGRLLYQAHGSPAKEFYPADLWQPGDIIRDPRWLSVDDDKVALYRVTVQVWQDGEPVGEVSTPSRFRITTEVKRGQITAPLSYTLGDEIALLGYDLACPDESDHITITLYWQALTDVTADYTLFLHLVDQQGALLAQEDGPPLGYDVPTSFWPEGELLADKHEISWPDALQENIRLRLGLYRQTDGQRLPVFSPSGERVPDDAIDLAVTCKGTQADFMAPATNGR